MQNDPTNVPPRVTNCISVTVLPVDLHETIKITAWHDRVLFGSWHIPHVKRVYLVKFNQVLPIEELNEIFRQRGLSKLCLDRYCFERLALQLAEQGEKFFPLELLRWNGAVPIGADLDAWLEGGKVLIGVSVGRYAVGPEMGWILTEKITEKPSLSSDYVRVDDSPPTPKLPPSVNLWRTSRRTGKRMKQKVLCFWYKGKRAQAPMPPRMDEPCPRVRGWKSLVVVGKTIRQGDSRQGSACSPLRTFVI